MYKLQYLIDKPPHSHGVVTIKADPPKSLTADVFHLGVNDMFT